MYKILLSNTLISAISYLIISVLGIASVSWLVKAYGLAAYGAIVLARLFLPSGLAMILEFGAADITSHVIASARGNGQWRQAGATLTALSVLIAASSTLICLLGYGLLPTLVAWAAPAQVDNLRDILEALRVNILLLPLAMMGLLAEGAIRGLEKYGLVRSIEVAASAGYALGCYCVIRAGRSYLDIVYLGIAIAAMRMLGGLICGYFCLTSYPLTLRSWRAEGLREAWRRLAVTMPNRLLGNIQTSSIPLVVGLALGPAAAGSYDVLMRLPRFAKAVLGLMNSAIMPFASRLEAEQRQADVTRMVEIGLVLMSAACAPPLFALAGFSEPILRLWLGGALGDFWAWQSFAFVFPMVSLLVGFALNALFSRTHVYRQLTYFVAMRILIQFAIGFALLHILGERAFILGLIVATLVMAFWEFKIIFREHRLSWNAGRQMLAVFGIGVITNAGAIPLAAQIHSATELLLGLGIYTIVFWLLVWSMVIPQTLKGKLRQLLPSALSRYV